MKRVSLITSVVCLMLVLAAGISMARPQPKVVTGTVYLDGKSHSITMLEAQGNLFLDVIKLSQITGHKVKKGEGRTVYFGSTLVRGAIKYNDKAYVNAGSFAQAMGYGMKKDSPCKVYYTSTGSPPQTGTAAGKDVPEPGTGKSGESVSLSITDKEKTDTSKPGEVMYSLNVRFTNRGDKVVHFSNNNLYLETSSNKRYYITRLKFRQTFSLNPGESGSSDRIYFVVPKDASINTLVLYKGGKVLGKTSF